MIYKCDTFKDFSGNVTSILLFGIIHQVKPYTEKAINKAIEKGIKFYCKAIDKEGNIYHLFSDYDACLQVSYRIAFHEKKEGK